MAVVLHASTDRHKQWGGPKRWVRVIIYDTLQEFQKVAMEHSYGRDDEWKHAWAGWFAPVHREAYDKKTDSWIDKTNKHYAGTIRFCAEHLEVDVVTHECVHASAYIYRQDVKKTGFIGVDCGILEESLCYIIGDLSQSVVDAIREHGKKEGWYE